MHVERMQPPGEYHVVDVSIDDALWESASNVTPEQLPPDWREPGNAACRAIGDAWLNQPDHPALLMVPSAVVPGVTNVLFDPLHVDAAQVSIAAIEPFVFDARLFDRA